MAPTNLTYRLLMIAPALTAWTLIACSGQPSDDLSAPAAAQSTTAATAGATVMPTAPVTVSGPEYDPTATMLRLYTPKTFAPEFMFQAMVEAEQNRDVSQVPIIIELLKFLRNEEFHEKAPATLQALTGQTIEANGTAWYRWSEWLFRNLDKYQPPEGYVEWKIGLFSQIDPRFAEFLAPAADNSRIDPVELVWGGVRPDGIPDLAFAPTISAGEAGYLLPDDRVFGVSINGEHRAYPLRIMNPHEMANDILGGEPIALAY